jgi:hypothetical protein
VNNLQSCEELSRSYFRDNKLLFTVIFVMDFDVRASRLEKEQKQRRAESKHKLAEEQKRMESYRAGQKELEELAARLAVEREVIEEQKRVEEETESARTKGIRFREELTPVPIDSDDDRVILPESCLIALTNANAFLHGALNFQVMCAGFASAATHCGVREFSAAEGTIGLPRKVVHSLTAGGGDIEQLGGKVSIKYVVLPKISFARLQPIASSFADVVNVKAALQENLKRHATLSVGDILSIWSRGRAYALRVVELRPESCGSLIDTDVEVELTVSEEYTNSAPAHTAAQRGVPDTCVPAANTAADVGLREVELPEEPLSAGPGVIECRLRTPQGASSTRRFLTSTPLIKLFEFGWLALGDAAVQLDTVQLATRVPRRVISFSQASKGGSFSDFGLSAAQEVFLVAVVANT